MGLKSVTEPCHVATLLGTEGAPVKPAHVKAVAAVLPGPGEPVGIEPGLAIDIAFSPEAGTDLKALSRAVEAALAPEPIDVILQDRWTRKKWLLVADMDSTMIGQECIDELADYAGIKPRIAAITERAMRGEIEFEPALRERVALLAGIPVGVVDTIIRDRITLSPGARTLVRTMRAHGAYTALVSGGFSLFTGPLSAALGFDEHRANILFIEHGALTGRVAEPILGRDAKRAALIDLRDRFGIAPGTTLAIGDGANDLAMIAEAGLGVAYRAKPQVAAEADARLDHADLSALLYAQGHARFEFVDDSKKSE